MGGYIGWERRRRMRRRIYSYSMILQRRYIGCREALCPTSVQRYICVCPAFGARWQRQHASSSSLRLRYICVCPAFGAQIYLCMETRRTRFPAATLCFPIKYSTHTARERAVTCWKFMEANVHVRMFSLKYNVSQV